MQPHQLQIVSMAAKNCFDMTKNLSIHVCHYGVVVKELLVRVNKPGSTPGDAVFCFFIPFFFLIGRFFLTLFFLLAFFPLFLLLTMLVMHLDQYIF